MNERFTSAFEDILVANKNGEMKNLLITDGNEEFLKDALCTLRDWALQNKINLVELDEREASWSSEIRTRRLFDKLNQPNTILLIKNYATVTYSRRDDNTPRRFLREVIMNRSYGYGNDLECFDELPNLLFVVVINDLSEMNWRRDEYMTFSIIHEDNEKMVWTNKALTLMSSKMHPVMSAVNKVRFWVSEDETTLCIDAREVFRGIRLKNLNGSRRLTKNDEIDMIHTYIESNLPDFHERVVCLILKNSRFRESEQVVVDGRRLRKSFPKLGSICCKENFLIEGIDNLCILDPFDLGEMSFNLAMDNDIAMANTFVRDLWALDHRWARFFREVARDYYHKPEEQLTPLAASALHNWTGMDHLFHIYLLGWYHSGDDFFDEEDKVYARAHKDFAKAIDLLAVRFRNCSIDEVVEKLYWDYRHVESDENPGYEEFNKVLHEAERLVPGVLSKMRDEGIIPRFEC